MTRNDNCWRRIGFQRVDLLAECKVQAVVPHLEHHLLRLLKEAHEVSVRPRGLGGFVDVRQNLT